MRAPATADLLAVVALLWWVRREARRAGIRAALQRAKEIAPAQFDLVKRIFPQVDEPSSLLIPGAVGAYAYLRLRGRR